jgi:hypothetical protein
MNAAIVIPTGLRGSETGVVGVGDRARSTHTGGLFSSLGRTEEENEKIDQDIFVAKEFAKMESSSRLYRQQQSLHDVSDGHGSHAHVTFQDPKDDFENFDDDFFADADTTLDYAKKRPGDRSADAELEDMLRKGKGSTKKARGIEIQWTEVDF